jgi:hypothetical protein
MGRKEWRREEDGSAWNRSSSWRGKTFVTHEKVTNDPPMTLILSLIGLGSCAYDAVEIYF